MTSAKFSRQALRDIDAAIDHMIAHGTGPAYAERFALAVAASAERVAVRPLIGHRRLELLPGQFRFCAVRGHDYLLVYNAEHPERGILRVVHMARDLGRLITGTWLVTDPDEP